MAQLHHKVNAPVQPGLVYLLDTPDVADVIRVLAVNGNQVRYEHLKWTLDDGWEPRTVVRSGSRERLERRLQRGHQRVARSAGDLMEIVFRNA